MKVVACEAYELTEAYIKQEELVKTDNTLFAIESSIQSDKVNDEIDIVTKVSKALKVNIATKALKAPEVNIATVTSEALETGNVTVIDLIINITIKLSIQSNEVLLN